MMQKKTDFVAAYKEMGVVSKYEYVQRLFKHGENAKILEIMERTKNTEDDPIHTKDHRLHVTFLHLAAKHGMLDVIEKCSPGSCNLDAGNHKGETPLHLAVHYNNAGCVRILLDRGARLLIHDNFKYNPFDYAKVCGSADSLKILHEYAKEKKLEDDGVFKELTLEQVKATYR